MEKIRRKTYDILKNAFELWGMKNWDASDIDPIVNMLFSAIAYESIHLEGKLKETNLKIRDHLIQSLVPRHQTSARPSFGMAVANPVEYALNQNKTHALQYTKFINKDATKDTINVLFRPVIESKLYNLKALYKYDGNLLTNLDNFQTYDAASPEHNCRSVWYGLSLHDYIDSLDELSIYLSFKDNLEMGQFLVNEFNFEENIQLYHENQKIVLQHGFDIDSIYDQFTGNNKNLHANTLDFLEVVKEVLYTYNDGYCRISADQLTNKKWLKRKYPKKFETIFTAEILEQIEEELLWLEFNFDSIPNNEFEKISIHFNAFPIINTNEVTVLISKDEPIQMIPLEKMEDMLTVTAYEVFDEYHNQLANNKKYRDSFIVRNIEMEKFTDFELQEMVEMLIEKFESENHAFQEHFNISPDEINKLREAIKPILLENTKRSKKKTQNNHFVIWNTTEQDDIASIEVKCAVTTGEFGNDIKSGEFLETKSPYLQPKSAMFISKTTGGRNELSNKQKILAIRNYILSNNKISNYDDIRAFCRMELGDLIKKIGVSEGVYKGTHHLKKCIRVDIELDALKVQDTNIMTIRQNIENKLRRKSSLIVPIIVHLKIQ